MKNNQFTKLHRVISGLLLTGIIPMTQAASLWNQPADVQAITEIENVMAGATDAQQLIQHFAPNATVLDAFAPGIHEGKDQILKALTQKLASVKTIDHKITEINIATDGKFACSAAQIHYDYALKDGATHAAEFRQLDAFKKVDGKWQLIQQQVSQPVDFKTTAVVMNGTTSSALPVRGAIKWIDTSFGDKAIAPAAAIDEIKDWTERALRVTGIGPAMHFYGPGDDVLLYGEFYPGNIRGLKGIENFYGPIMNSYSSIEVKNPVFAADSDGLLGAQIDTQVLKLHMNDGSKRDIAIRQSDCLRRVNGQWHTFLEMVSFPIDRDTGKAVMTAAENAH
ncbi:MAG: nuclear transport factor 2 family protein [Verrucomicrobiaceae bacterium]|nr:nuclear transport factor 2 family protein [Verrucomicrobiaceae bacterium]